MKNKRKKITVWTSALILSVTVLSVFLFSFVFLFSHNNINAAYDEMLFSLEKGGSITEYYYNIGDGDEYVPELYATSKSALERKIWFPLEEISPYLKNGFVSVEDRRFYKHKGFDLGRTVKAFFNSIFHFEKNFGASTITQQVVKNISGDNEITVKRKFTEILRAIKIENNHSKNEIIELYMNIVPMGENIFGVGGAAKFYFGKTPMQLTAAQAATLIGITNAPTKYNPHKNKELCISKRNEILWVMFNEGALSEDEYNDAISSSLEVIPIENEDEKIDDWFVETVNKEVIDSLMNSLEISYDVAERLVLAGGLKIYTTVNPEIQKKLENYFENTENFPKNINEGLDFAMTICDSANADLVGIVGSVGKKTGNKLLNLAQTPHTPGSSLKPIALYAPLIDNGKINYATVFDDVPVTFFEKNSTFSEYPKNYPNVYDGLTTVKDAVKKSKNTVAVRLFNMLGAESIYRSLKNDFGFDTLIRSEYQNNGEILTDVAAAPLALGQLSYGISLRKLTEAYTVFSSEGTLGNSRSFVSVYDNHGRLLLDNPKTENRIYKKETARIMNHLLMNVTDSGTAKKITLKEMVDTAGKTGTSGDDKDRLFIGYTPYYTAGIWCGYRDSDKSVGKLNKTHLEVWDAVMKDIHKDILRQKSEDKILHFSSAGLIRMPFCKDSGKLYTEKCSLDPRGSRLDYGYFTPSYLPKTPCDKHVLCYYDCMAEGVANEYCPKEDVKLISLLNITDRHFPKEIIISDADYVYLETDGTRKYGESYDVPYYLYYIEEGDFIGRGRKKKQYNSYCYIHSE